MSCHLTGVHRLLAVKPNFGHVGAAGDSQDRRAFCGRAVCLYLSSALRVLFDTHRFACNLMFQRFFSVTGRGRELGITPPKTTAIVSECASLGLGSSHRAFPPLLLRCSSGGPLGQRRFGLPALQSALDGPIQDAVDLVPTQSQLLGHGLLVVYQFELSMIRRAASRASRTAVSLSRKAILSRW